MAFRLALTGALAAAAGVVASDDTGAAAAAAAPEVEDGGVFSSVKAAVFDLPVVGTWLAGFEPTLFNIALVFAAALIVNLVVRRMLYPPDPNLPPFYNPGVPVLGAFFVAHLVYLLFVIAAAVCACHVAFCPHLSACRRRVRMCTPQWVAWGAFL
jgi:hypothetical protein